MASLISQNANANGGSSATIAVTLPSVTAGKPVIVAFKYEGLTTSTSVSDGTTGFTPATEIRHSNNDLAVRLFYLLNPIGSGTTVTFTCTLGAARSFLGLQVFHFTGTGSASFDVEGGSSGNGTTVTTGNLSSGGSEVFALAFHGNYTGTTSNTGLWGGAAADGEQSDGVQDYAWYKGLTSPGTVAGTATATNGDWVVAGLIIKFGSSPTPAIPGETVLNHFSEGIEDLGIPRTQSLFRGQTGIIPQGQKIYNIPFSFQHVERELEIPRVQSQFKGLAGVQPGPTAGYRTYNRLSLFQADPTDLSIDRVKNVFNPRTGIIPSTKRTYLRNADIDNYAERFDFFGWSIILASASPGADPLPDAIIRKTITNAYVEALDLNWNNTSTRVNPRLGIVPPPTKSVYNYIFTNPIFVDTPFEFENAVKATGNKIGIPGAIPRRVVRALTEIARQIQDDINEFPRLYIGIRVHQIIGAPPPPDPTGNLLKRQNVGVGVKLQGG